MRKNEESGAVAVIVGVMAIFLIGMTAFTADVGLAYANKRQIQTAADAAVLAAASELAEYPGNCAAIIAAGSTAAQAEATSKVSLNDMDSLPASLGSDYSASCVSGVPTVSTSVTANVPRIFGNLFGSGDYALTRSAAAVVEVTTVVGSGLRPLAICSSELPATIVPGDVWTIFAPGNGHTPPAGCPVPPNAGNWWTLDCGEELDPLATNDGGGTNQLENQILNGCKEPVEIVPGQGAVPPATSPPTGAALNTILANSCPSASTANPFKCLSGDPGQPDAGQVADAWKALIDDGTTINLPVFCAPQTGVTPTCATSSITGIGTNAVFPVHKFVSVVVCGYHFAKQDNKQYAKSPPSTSCAPHSGALAAMLADDDNSTGNRAYLILAFKSVQTSGATTPSTCPINASCDGLGRQVRLVAGPYTE